MQVSDNQSLFNCVTQGLEVMTWRLLSISIMHIQQWFNGVYTLLRFMRVSTRHSFGRRWRLQTHWNNVCQTSCLLLVLRRGVLCCSRDMFALFSVFVLLRSQVRFGRPEIQIEDWFSTPLSSGKSSSIQYDLVENIHRHLLPGNTVQGILSRQSRDVRGLVSSFWNRIWKSAAASQAANKLGIIIWLVQLAISCSLHRIVIAITPTQPCRKPQ